MAGAAAAAAGVLVAAILYFGPAEEQAATGGDGGEALTEPERGGGPAAAAEADSQAGTTFAQIPKIQTTDQDYTPQSLAALGRRLRAQSHTALAADFPRTAQRYFEQNDLTSFPPRVRAALTCALREVPPEQLLVPFLAQQASFEGEPAYVTAFLQGPSPSAPYDRVLIWVVDRKTCSLRYFASQRL
jgi:hypothetical protein